MSYKNFIISILVIFSVILLTTCNKDKNEGTCSDGVQNQEETGIDCGGPCPACPSCSDGIQNQEETGVDCGGPCPACPTCSDGIQNQGETGVDCGGPCPPCIDNIMTAKIDGVPWSAASLSFQYIPGNFWFEGSTAIIPVKKIKVVHKGVWVIGSYPLDTDSQYTDENGIIFVCSSGTIVFSLFDEVNKIISGTFSFSASDGLTNVSITDGVFQNLQYQVKK